MALSLWSYRANGFALAARLPRTWWEICSRWAPARAPACWWRGSWSPLVSRHDCSLQSSCPATPHRSSFLPRFSCTWHFVVLRGYSWTKTFAPCYSQSPPTADFILPLWFSLTWDLYITAKSGWGLGFFYYLIVYLWIYSQKPQRNCTSVSAYLFCVCINNKI